MTKLARWKFRGFVFLMYAGTAITTNAQSFTKLGNLTPINRSPLYVLLAQSANGRLYGTSPGSIFTVTVNGIQSVIYNFCSEPNCLDGNEPGSGLILGTDGNFYGTTEDYGANGDGTVFKINPQGEFTSLYSFCAQPNCIDGRYPVGQLVQGANLNFFGTTAGGGVDGLGVIYEVTSSGTVVTLHSLSESEGSDMAAGLTQASNGYFYGTTIYGGIQGSGTIFKISPQGTFTTVHNFISSDGAFPYATMIQGKDGKLYGTTSEGGSQDFGTVFRITPEGTLKTLYSFSGPDGANPFAGLVQATDGNLYGATSNGGANGFGTLFKINTEGILTTLHSFDGSDGASPIGTLVQATNGELYGLTNEGGDFNCDPRGCGTVFSLGVGLGPFVAFVRPYGKAGQTGGILGQGLTGTTSVTLNGIPAGFTVASDTFIKATVPSGATTGYVTVTTPTGVLTSNVPFHVIP